MVRVVQVLVVSRRGAGIPAFLDDESIAVTSVPDGVRAIHEFERTCPDVVILDFGEDFASLLQFFYSLRSIEQVWPTPVAAIFDPEHKKLILSALEAGIDECIDSSLDPEEVVARIRALARRSKLVASSNKMHFADVVLDPVNIKAWRGGRLVPLSILQFRLLKFFMAHPGRVFTRGQLLHTVWPGGTIDEGTVTQCVVRLRRALTTAGETDLIRSARGVGYALDDDAIASLSA